MKVIKFILFDPKKLFTSVLPRLTLLRYCNYAQAILRVFFLKRNYCCARPIEKGAHVKLMFAR